MKKLYLFDFDGTLTFKDTMFLFLRFCEPKKFYFQFILHLPLFVVLKMKLVDAEKVKKSFISSILKGKNKRTLDDLAQSFFEKNYPSLLRPNALDFLKKNDFSTSEGYIVTASLDIWVRPFATALGVNLISTEMAFENGIFHGNFATPNCNGEEKVRRIRKAIGDRKFDKIIAFGDTAGDRPMLKWADDGYFRYFH